MYDIPVDMKLKYVMKKICCLFALLLFFSCGNVEQNDPELLYVKFTYVWKGIESCNAWNKPSDVLSFEEKADTIVTDSCFYEMFTQLLNSIPTDTIRKSGDYRIVAQIYHKDSTVSVMCCDDVFGCSMVDNVYKQQSSELMDFLNHLLYDEKGYRRLIERGIMLNDSAPLFTTEEVQRRIDKSMKFLKEQGVIFY